MKVLASTTLLLFLQEAKAFTPRLAPTKLSSLHVSELATEHATAVDEECYHDGFEWVEWGSVSATRAMSSGPKIDWIEKAFERMGDDEIESMFRLGLTEDPRKRNTKRKSTSMKKGKKGPWYSDGYGWLRYPLQGESTRP